MTKLVAPGVFYICIAAAIAQTPIKSVLLEEGWRNPTTITSAPGDEARMFVVEQNFANIMIVKDGVFLLTPFLSLGGLTGQGGEKGLLGLAFHPRWASNGYFYVSYTRAADNALMIVRYQVSATNPDLADQSSARTILGPLTKPYSDHNGGCLQFGPDGYLYISVGDGGHPDGNSPDPSCNAQNRGSLFGKILRLDVDGGVPYAIPAGNPFVGVPGARGEIWALGLRNPWRMSFDRVTGDLWIGDVGHEDWEEINFQPASSRGGENYGWKIMEGTHCFGLGPVGCPPTVPPCHDPSLRLPIHEYPHTTGCAVIGGHVYRGCAIPDLRGCYFFSDFCANRIWSFRYVNGQVTDFRDRTPELTLPAPLTPNTITAFGEDARGELYMAGYLGKAWKIVANAPAPAVDLGHAKVGTSGQTPRFDACGLLTSGNSAEFRLFRALGATAAVLVLSDTQNPVALFQGTLVPNPPRLFAAFLTGLDGATRFTHPGGGGTYDVFGQYLIYDPGASDSVAFSNALKITLRP